MHCFAWEGFTLMDQEVITWNDYKNWITGLVKEKMSFFCRGQANQDWKLQTSFHRSAKHNDITLLQYLDSIIPEVHYHICAVRDELIDLRNEQEFGAFLALLQHHGFPTPLLDWTLSPYMAAYFAYREVNDVAPQSENVKVFIFDYLDWKTRFQQPLNLRETAVQYVSVLRPYAKYNPRLIPQQGVFTVTNVDDMAAYIYERGVEVKKTFLYTALLSPTVMKELNLMGINEMTLFPGINGICHALKTQFFSPESVGLTFKEIVDLMSKSHNQGNQK